MKFNIDSESPLDLRAMTYGELSELSAELRERILNAVSQNGGHLASNLGVVELTLAIHRVFSLPYDKVIFDVGHQSYVHKMLSGRAKGFSALRNLGGVSGFQLRSESEYDFFGGGHSGTSVSAAIGFAEANKLSGGENYAVAVVGDGSFTNGMIYEALNNASKDGLRLVIIINDNEMSISKNVGGMSDYFGRLRASVKYYRFKRKFKHGLKKMKGIGRPIAFVSRKFKDLVKRIFFKTNLFEHLGVDYMGPVDGHNIKKLEAVFKEAKYLENPVIVHVCTKKGKGYAPAETCPDLYHSVGSFNKETGLPSGTIKDFGGFHSFSECFGKSLQWYASENLGIVAITAAMCEGTGLSKFKEKFPERFFDVGIAEEHAVTFAGGLAAAGKTPVFAVYSSFLQRAYDQIIHDVAMQGLHVIFAIDRAGFVPGDGMTHQGIFDCAFLIQIPGMTVYTPENYTDVHYMLEKAIKADGPVAIRYPRGTECSYQRELFTESENLRYRFSGSGREVTVITYGRTTRAAFDASELLSDSYKVKTISLKKVKPIDYKELWSYCEGSELIFFAEEQIKAGGVSESIVSAFAEAGRKLPKIEISAIDGEFPPHADLNTLYDKYSLTGEKIADKIRELMR